ncbi:MAG: dynamin family protein [Clostridiales bacterium]|nr:dynamin family protein [Clostridiales bacterium]
MERIKKAFTELKEINKRYSSLSETSGAETASVNKSIDSHLSKIDDEKVCTPLIGMFSSGKSSLINCLLGGDLLKTDITPETAVPAEIIYSSGGSRVIAYGENGSSEITIDDYFDEKYSEKVSKFKFMLKEAEFLAEIPDIMLVDMPGFESGIEVHNMSIDNYASNSQAYIVTFAADDMILRQTLSNVLMELCRRNMPVYVIITKCDKAPAENLKAAEEKLLSDLRKCMNRQYIPLAYTSSNEENIDDFKKILIDLQSKAAEIIYKKYVGIFETIASGREAYLKGLLEKSGLSESDLEEKEDELKAETQKMLEDVKKEESKFQIGLKRCIAALKGDVNTALHSNEDSLVEMLLNGRSANEELNSIVRNAVTDSINKNFVPLVEKYGSDISDIINVEGYYGEGIAPAIKVEDDIVGPVIKGIAAYILLGLTVWGALLVAAFAFLKNVFSGNKKREEKRNQIRQKLNSEVFPKIAEQTGASAKEQLEAAASQISEKIRASVEERRNTMQQSLNDLKAQIAAEKEEKDRLEQMARSDLNRIGEIRNGL